MIVAGPSALYLAGLRAVAGPADPVHGIMPAPQKTHRYYPQGIAVHESVHPVEVDPASDPQVPRTHTLRAIWDSCRWLHAPQALGVADAALHKSLATVLDYRAFEQAPPDPRMKWSRQAGTVLAAADGRVRHPHISAIRATLLHQRSVPAPQIMVRLAPEPGPVLDLAWVRQRVGIVLGKAGAVAAAKLRWRTLAVDPDTPPDLPTIVRRITALLAEGPAAAQANAKVTLGR
jgi:hypothetical protein